MEGDRYLGSPRGVVHSQKVFLKSNVLCKRRRIRCGQIWFGQRAGLWAPLDVPLTCRSVCEFRQQETR